MVAVSGGFPQRLVPREGRARGTSVSHLERRVIEGAWIKTLLLALGTDALTEVLIFLAGRELAIADPSLVVDSQVYLSVLFCFFSGSRTRQS